MFVVACQVFIIVDAFALSPVQCAAGPTAKYWVLNRLNLNNDGRGFLHFFNGTSELQIIIVRECDLTFRGA